MNCDAVRQPFWEKAFPQDRHSLNSQFMTSSWAAHAETPAGGEQILANAKFGSCPKRARAIQSRPLSVVRGSHFLVAIQFFPLERPFSLGANGKGQWRGKKLPQKDCGGDVICFCLFPDNQQPGEMSNPDEKKNIAIMMAF